MALKNDYREALNGLGAKLGEQETQQARGSFFLPL